VIARRKPRIPNRWVKRSIRVLRTLFGPYYARRFAIRFWDGTVVPAQADEQFILSVHTPYALRAAFAPPFDLNPGRAFVDGVLGIEGDLEAAVDLLMRSADRLGVFAKVSLAFWLHRLPRPPKPNDENTVQLEGVRHSRTRDAAAIRFHYDQPVEFYRAFLDSRLVYSCAYFEDETRSLEEAQLAKLDYVLRKVNLAPNDSLLDVGCGWGSLVIRAAEYGARALGITLSRPQYEEARRRIAAAGVGDRVAVELRDYRDLGEARFDKIVSVGMVEHVGRERLADYFRSAFRALRPGGLFLNHGIAEQSPERLGYRVSGFLARYVFPDGDLLPISELLAAAERIGFEVRDVENLREHYVRTLRAWVANLERNAAAAIAASGLRTYRVWRLYLAGSAQGFASGRTGVFQSLLARPRADGVTELPETRRWLYA
jgi:cyclopropane-fatty-acyl-phospholipid synthase